MKRESTTRIRGTGRIARAVAIPLLAVGSLILFGGLVDPVEPQLPSDQAIARCIPLVIAVFLILIVRSLFLGVYLGQDRIVVKSWFRTRTISGASFERCEPVEWSSWVNWGNLDGSGSAFIVLRIEWAEGDRLRGRTYNCLIASHRVSFIQAGLITAYLQAPYRGAAATRDFATGEAGRAIVRQLGEHYDARRARSGRHATKD